METKTRTKVISHLLWVAYITAVHVWHFIVADAIQANTLCLTKQVTSVFT